MKTVVWTLREIVTVTGAHGATGVPDQPVTGVSIDTRTLEPGDLFVALKDVRDGHEFVALAFERGAAAALVRGDHDPHNADPRLLRVGDPLRALETLGRAARARLAPNARVIAVTGSAGKTTTKEMLRVCLEGVAPGEVHASEKSYNNHWGVPLTLARMPATTRYGVFEIGMNHAGEIAQLSPMVRPHVAVITTVGLAHLENFDGPEKIADAKAEIFLGLTWQDPLGEPKTQRVAILPGDNPHFERLRESAVNSKAATKTFGMGPGWDSEVTSVGGGSVGIRLVEGNHDFRIDWHAHGSHMARNLAAVALAVHEAIGPWSNDLPSMQDVDRYGQWRNAQQALQGWRPGVGRGQAARLGDGITLIDESYNANPASMRAALETAALQRGLGQGGGASGRLIAVLGDMLELGEQSRTLHEALAEPIEDDNVDLVFACGPQMKHLFDALPEAQRGAWALTARELEAPLLATVRGGDVVMVKGSNGMRLSALVEALKKSHSAAVSDGNSPA